MSHLARLFSNMSAFFCAHEWARRVQGRRVYLECVHCLATTPGLDVGQQRVASADALVKPVGAAARAA